MKLSEKDKDWLAHLSKEDKVKIVPFDKSAEEKFQKVKVIIKEKIGKEVEVEHRGASSLGISGQDEIDIYIPILKKDFEKYTKYLIELFGEPRSVYLLERIRFKINIDGKKVDVFLIDKEGEGWLNGLKFEEYLKNNKECLRRYEELKESGNGMSVQEYYTRKVEFINNILDKCKI